MQWLIYFTLNRIHIHQENVKHLSAIDLNY